MRTVLSSILVSGMLLLVVACGGDDDDDSADGGAGDNGGSTPTAEATASGDATAEGADGDDVDDGDEPAGGAGTASVTAGDETFTFSGLECSFGTGIVRAPGTNDAGEDAFLQASMPVDDSGKPKDAPEEVGINVWVGRAQLTGPSQYEYVVGDTAGEVLDYTDDGSSASGTVRFEYRENDGAREGLSDADLVEGTFELSCP